VTGIPTSQIWPRRNSNDLAIEIMGSQDKITVSGGFGSNAGAQPRACMSATWMRQEF
jgi:hypothetical protein